ncbi:MAG: hypothetical protein ACJ71T_09095 [Actinomycetales bacterium]
MTETQETRRARQALMQAVIEDLVLWAPGRTVAEASERLQAELMGRGLPPQPAKWVDAVASDAVAGRTYVVSEEAAADTDLDLRERNQLESGASLDQSGTERAE